jgi:hypothetical protein
MPVLTQIQVLPVKFLVQVLEVEENIDLFAKDFKLPQVFKASIAVDQNCR